MSHKNSIHERLSEEQRWAEDLQLVNKREKIIMFKINVDENNGRNLHIYSSTMHNIIK